MPRETFAEGGYQVELLEGEYDSRKRAVASCSSVDFLMSNGN